MTTAMMHDVDTILLLFPDFTWPTDEFVERYADHVEGVLSLAKYGISVDHVQEALKLLTSRPNILLPRKVTLSMMDVVASKLVAQRRGQMESSTHHGIETKDVPSKRRGSEEKNQPDSAVANVGFLGRLPQSYHGLRAHVVRDLVDLPAIQNCRVVAVVDQGDWEAVCAALLVREAESNHFTGEGSTCTFR